MILKLLLDILKYIDKCCVDEEVCLHRNLNNVTIMWGGGSKHFQNHPCLLLDHRPKYSFGQQTLHTLSEHPRETYLSKCNDAQQAFDCQKSFEGFDNLECKYILKKYFYKLIVLFI